MYRWWNCREAQLVLCNVAGVQRGEKKVCYKIHANKIQIKQDSLSRGTNNLHGLRSLTFVTSPIARLV